MAARISERISLKSSPRRIASTASGPAVPMLPPPGTSPRSGAAQSRHVLAQSWLSPCSSNTGSGPVLSYSLHDSRPRRFRSRSACESGHPMPALPNTRVNPCPHRRATGTPASPGSRRAATGRCVCPRPDNARTRSSPLARRSISASIRRPAATSTPAPLSSGATPRREVALTKCMPRFARSERLPAPLPGDHDDRRPYENPDRTIGVNEVEGGMTLREPTPTASRESDRAEKRWTHFYAHRRIDRHRRGSDQARHATGRPPRRGPESESCLDGSHHRLAPSPSGPGARAPRSQGARPAR